MVVTDGVPTRTKFEETWGITPSYLSMLGIHPAIGRGFAPADLHEGSPTVALIGHNFFLTRFGGDPGVVGRVVHVRERYQSADVPITIVGVLPEDYWRDAVLVMPMKPAGQYRHVIARLRADVPLASAQAQLSAAIAPGPAGPVRLAPLASQAHLQRNPSQLAFLLAATLSLLVLACVSVATLGLAAGFRRQREFMIRSALGAGRSRLIAQVVIEHVILAGIAAAGGLFINLVLLDGILDSFGPGLIPRDARPRLDPAVLIAVTGLVMAAGIAIGILPALRMSRAEPRHLTERGMPRRFSRLRFAGRRQTVLAAQVAFTVAVMIGSGLFVRSYLRMISADPGFDVHGLISLHVTPIDQDDQAVAKAFYASLLASIRSLPGVEAAGLTDAFGTSAARVSAGGGAASYRVRRRQVTVGVLQALGVSVLQGRLSDDADVAACGDCVVMSETAARRLFGSEGAVGRTIDLAGTKREVRAVVSDVNFTAPFRSDLADVYLFTDEIHPPLASVVIRARGGAGEVRQRLPSIVAGLGPRAVVDEVRTGLGLLDQRIDAYRHKAVLAGVVGLIALVMSCVGIVAVTAYAVTSRVHEMAIRLALGGSRRAIIAGVVRDSLVPTFAGLAAGAGIAWASGRVLAGFLLDLAPTDAVTYGLTGVLFVICALAASYLPARRAAALNPSAALRLPDYNR